jgi:hypothetical protein
MQLITGKVSGLSQETQITGASTSGNQFSSTTVMHSHNEIHFRVDNQPIHIKLDKKINVMEGEDISVAGEFKKGIFRGYALKNISTGIIYAFSYFKLIFGIVMGLILGGVGGITIILGVGLNGSIIVMGIGTLLVLISLYVLYMTALHLKANGMISKLE